jgi:magnesium transporter
MSDPGAESNIARQNIEIMEFENLKWVDIVPPSAASMKYLQEQFHFDIMSLEDCLSRKQVSKVDILPGYLFFVFHFPHYDKDTRISTKRQWSAFIGEDFIVTVHTGELKSLVTLFRECQSNEELRQEYFSHGSGYLLYRILDRAIDSYFPVLDKILNLLEDVEDSVFDEEAEDVKELSVLRRDIIAQRMVMFPTRTVLMELKNKLNRYSKIDLTVYYDDLMDHVNKICQTLDECKELIEVYHDTDYTLTAYRINRVIRILNVLATIILPFLVVSSIYGMNVPLPGGLERGDLKTFIVLMVIMILLSAGMLYYFRRRRWI